MLSGNGRHRRPRQAPALIVAAGVTGSAIAIPLLGAGAASAADTATWNRVADCESGGDWGANLGNGYYGGLQISQETWESYGGTAYAPRADLARPAEQISVAELVLAAQGASAWQSCGVITGLTASESGPAGTPSATDPLGGPVKAPSFGDGAATAPEPDAGAPSAGAGPDAGSLPEAGSEPSATPSGSSGPAEPAAPAEPSGEPSGAVGHGDSPQPPGGAADGGAGKHRGAPAAEGAAPGESGDGREEGRHPSRGDESARDDADAGEGYLVRAGDSLSSIADAHRVPGGWPALYEANRDVVGVDANLILPGQSLDLGAEEGELAQ
ncbi:LysM peptidoglycan-binding domain-containing protein [Streptomyces pacificus]|uniref:LysM peptidoglycan-binding domain-containing protein n=1 Tax=Streptomyces pacificus TaxID=2705029 RepID=A0A6A0AWL4_9ACTN|nr:transglycosylase family protein [Streptomyces pacificus]GFH37286.1 LysM peptidoglycan-binding domain-containing protein [Streptomyces pacificus]